MTLEEIYAAQPGPELDALVHEYYGDGSSPMPPYSTVWETASRLAGKNNLSFRLMVIGECDVRVIMSTCRDGRPLKIADAMDLKGPGTIVPDETQATLVSRCMLKLKVYPPHLHSW